MRRLLAMIGIEIDTEMRAYKDHGGRGGASAGLEADQHGSN